MSWPSPLSLQLSVSINLNTRPVSEEDFEMTSAPSDCKRMTPTPREHCIAEPRECPKPGEITKKKKSEHCCFQ